MPDSSSVFEHLQVYDLQMCMHLLKNLMEDGGRGEGRERERRESERERDRVVSGSRMSACGYLQLLRH